MRDEYDFSPEELRKGIRGKFAARYKSEVNLPIGTQPEGNLSGCVGHESDALAVLEKLAGTVEAPSDLAAEHDRYLYGTPKRADSP